MAGNFYEVLSAAFVVERDCFRRPDEGAVTYGDLVRAVDAAAERLRAEGVAPGDRVVLIAEKSWEVVAVYLATLKAGAVFVPLNPSYTPAELDYFLGDCRPKAVVRDPPDFIAGALAAAVARPSATEPRAPGDAASIVYTSGTTGRSKGAILTHGGLAANGEAVRRAWGFDGGDVLLHALPVFHVHGLYIALHCALLSSSPMVWLAKFSEAAVLAGLREANVLMGVPTFYTRLLAHPGFTRELADGVRLFVSGSAPLLPTTFDAFEARSGQRILERYGMSEALVIATNPLDGERRGGSVGFPVEGLEVRIAGGAEVGGIEIRGESVFAGYWEQPDKTAEAFTSDGWFVTGDVGRLDPDGRLWISGREKDLIITGGFNVYPKEIELILDELPGVVESAVIGLPHPDFGEAVTAVVLGEAVEGRLLAAARESLAPYKVPKRVIFVDELPRNAMGKVQKNLLRARFGDIYT
ncbi:MAG: AMP-binding protein [Caulobacteraceae bacterium]|nr:AMP-binding protein [Caulobacteraceae bacterium]